MGTENSDDRWLCSSCGEDHGEIPFHYNSPAPYLFYTVPEEERETRVKITPDLCMIDEEHFYLKGNLSIPVSDHDDNFSWDVWVELSANHFQHVLDLWEFEGRAQEPPYPSTLATRLPLYPDTLVLKADVQSREVGLKPIITVEETDHPLSVEQRNGFTIARVQQIAEQLHHLQESSDHSESSDNEES